MHAWANCMISSSPRFCICACIRTTAEAHHWWLVNARSAHAAATGRHREECGHMLYCTGVHLPGPATPPSSPCCEGSRLSKPSACWSQQSPAEAGPQSPVTRGGSVHVVRHASSYECCVDTYQRDPSNKTTWQPPLQFGADLRRHDFALHDDGLQLLALL